MTIIVPKVRGFKALRVLIFHQLALGICAMAGWTVVRETVACLEGYLAFFGSEGLKC